jgi:hypothetical protein
MRSQLLTASLFIAAVCTAQTAPVAMGPAAGHAVHVVVLGLIKAGNPDLNNAVRAAARRTIQRYDREIAVSAEAADAVLEIEVRQLAEPDAQSSGKFVEVRAFDTKTHARIFLTDQAADRGTDADIVQTAEKAVSEFFNPTIPPPPL